MESFDVKMIPGFLKIHFIFLPSTIPKQKFNTEPLVFIYEDLKDEPQQFIENFVDSIGEKLIQAVDFSTKHGSYNEKQLKVIKTISQCINERRCVQYCFITPIMAFFLFIIRYSILYLALIIPHILVSKKALINEVYLKK